MRKSERSQFLVRCGWIVSLLGLLIPFRTLAQTQDGTPPITIPTVTIQATSPVASVSGQTGTFTLFRAGGTNATLNVFCQIGGTASNGVDYATISSFVSIPAGASSATVTITPVNHGQTGIETVVLTLAPSPELTPVNYLIGDPNTATVYIEGNGVTNVPPVVNIVEPDNGDVFYAPTSISLLAKASDPDGTVTNVEFVADGTDLGQGHIVVIDPAPGYTGITGPVYLLTWPSPPLGPHVLTAVATDNDGASTTSDPVDISVKPGPPPPTNAPVVRITSPPNHAVFCAPANIPIFAYAHAIYPAANYSASTTADPITNVEFYANRTNDLGRGHRVSFVGQPTPLADFVLRIGEYTLVWSNATQGAYALTAVATDDRGVSGTSAPVNITIVSPNTSTNKPDVVSVVASDPVAIEGTNCWTWVGLTNTPPTWSYWPIGVCRLFTNCGPKNATFTVWRLGDLSSNLTVNYSLGGTASNGVDYVMLPGAVTIPGGQSDALVTIVPIDDGPPDVNKTVVLSLDPPGITPPPYILGIPRHAAVVIIDSNFPRPVSAVMPDQCFHLAAAGPDGAWFAVQYSSDLLNWTPVCTNQVVNGCIDFVDPDAPGSPTRFYRAAPQQ
jgi:hypothetical protein